MLRAALLNSARRVSSPSVTGVRFQSGSYKSNQQGGSFMKKLLFGLTATGAGGLAYATMDPKFAKLLSETIPQLEPVLVMIGCDLSGSSGSDQPSAAAAVLKEVTNTIKEVSGGDSPSLLKKPIEAIKDQIESTKKPVKGGEPTKAAPESAKTMAGSEASKENELRKQKLNFILEQALRDATASAERLVTDATSGMESAAERTDEYATKLMRALDEAIGADDHHMWQAANEAKLSQAAAQKKAETKAGEAIKALQRLQEAIKKGRTDPSTADNLNLEQADRTLSKLQDKVNSSAIRVRKELEKLNLAEKFHSQVEESKKQLVEEVNAILPPGKTLANLKSLSTDDMNVLILHAHKKIEALTRELSRMQLSDDEKAKQFRQQLATLDKEVDKQKSELARMVAQKVQEEREAFEVELQNQLRRQIGVHTEHLKEALEDQRAELTRSRQMEIEKAREEERMLQVERLGEAVENLQKMEAHLHSRKVLDEASKKAKSLWLSCASLKHVLAQGRNEKNEPQSLAADIVPLREVSESSEFVKAVLSAIPEEALKRGVYPEARLKERFYRVETACRRLALMEDQNGGGPGRHLLSHLMSMFMIYPKPVPREELTKEQKVNPLMWDTLDILSRVRASVQTDDLEQALRYANQLKGQPRQAAIDWIKEVRLLLETRQAASALMAYAAATVAQDQPK